MGVKLEAQMRSWVFLTPQCSPLLMVPRPRTEFDEQLFCFLMSQWHTVCQKMDQKVDTNMALGQVPGQFQPGPSKGLWQKKSDKTFVKVRMVTGSVYKPWRKYEIQNNYVSGLYHQAQISCLSLALILLLWKCR